MKWIIAAGIGVIVLAALVYAVLAVLRKWLNSPTSDLNRIYDSTML